MLWWNTFELSYDQESVQLLIDAWFRAKAPQDAQQVFEEARRLVKYHYQWIVRHQFLPLIVPESIIVDRFQASQLPSKNAG